MAAQDDRVPVCYAPDLTPAQLARYQELIDALPEEQRRLRDTMTDLMKPVRIWMDLPESTRQDTRLLRATVGDREHTVVVTPLEREHIQLLWDVTPYEDELPPVRDFLETVQAEENHRNGVKREQWYEALFAQAFAERFPGVDREAFLERRELRRQLRKLFVDHPDYANITAKVVEAATGRTEAEFQQDEKLFADLFAYLGQVRSGAQPPAVPKPQLESTELRDAAQHLYWHVYELALDREPLTLSKLG